MHLDPRDIGWHIFHSREKMYSPYLKLLSRVTIFHTVPIPGFYLRAQEYDTLM